MGRCRKVGLNYYPFDVDFPQDIRIRKLVKYKDGRAITVYVLLLCSIYKNGYYMEWDDDVPFIISEQTGFDEEYILDVIKYCAKVGLFSEELFAQGVLTSKSIQERYIKICAECRRSSGIKEYDLISSEEKPITSEEKGISSEEITISSEEKPINSEKSTQSKVKESKVNTLPPNTPPKGAKPKPPKEKTLNTKAKEIFEEYYKDTFGNNYYWSAKDAGGMAQLLKKIKFQLGGEPTDDMLIDSLRSLLSSITDKWVLEHMSIPILNSKYNEILPKSRPTTFQQVNNNVNDLWNR